MAKHILIVQCLESTAVIGQLHHTYLCIVFQYGVLARQEPVWGSRWQPVCSQLINLFHYHFSLVLFYFFLYFVVVVIVVFNLNKTCGFDSSGIMELLCS